MVTVLMMIMALAMVVDDKLWWRLFWCASVVDADGHGDGGNGNLLPRPLFHRSLEAGEQPVQLCVEQPNLMIVILKDISQINLLGTPGANKDSCVWLFSLCLPPILCFSPPIFHNLSFKDIADLVWECFFQLSFNQIKLCKNVVNLGNSQHHTLQFLHTTPPCRHTWEKASMPLFARTGNLSLGHKLAIYQMRVNWSNCNSLYNLPTMVLRYCI